MKKSMKRILCGTLATLMFSSLGLERILRSDADASPLGTTTTASATFKNVTGQFNTSELMAQYFNSTVAETSEMETPTYETRTVIVTLSDAPLADTADGANVSEYAQTFAGTYQAGKIRDQQDQFLRKLTKAGIPYTLEKRYETVVNGVAIEVNTKHVSAIKEMSGVESAVIATTYAEPETVSTSSGEVVTNKTSVYNTGIYDSSDFTETYGDGMVVAILDTGLDYTHSAFQNFKSSDVELAWDKAYVENILANNQLTSETKSGSLTAADVYVSDKVPFAYDYADNDADVYPSYSNHGTHVAGIIGGYDPSGYTDKDGKPVNEEFIGVVPDAQLAIFKVFTDDLDSKDLGGAEAENIIAALDDCVTLGVDVINMSLGTSCGFTSTNDGDSEGELLNAVYERIRTSGITLVCAASNDYSSGYGGAYGTNLAENPDSGTVGSPSTFAAALSVASINGQKASYMVANADTDYQSYVFYEESRDIDGNPFDFAGDMLKLNSTGEFEYVVIPGVGRASDYTTTVQRKLKDGNGKSLGRIAVIKRGVSTFEEKVEIAMEYGAAGVIVYNNVAGIIRMNLGEIENPVPAVSVNMNAGDALVTAAEKTADGIGKLSVNTEYAAGPFMSEFSSWGPTHDLKLKPEITAHGGEITSTVPGGYGEQSGTSMASPNMAGFMALVRSYIEKDMSEEVQRIMDAYDCSEAIASNRLAMQLTMSTAATVYDQDDLPYSPRKQGAGVARLENVIGGTGAYLWTDVAENDYRPKIELGDDPDKKGVYTLNFNITNFGGSELSFTTGYEAMTETLSLDGLTVSEQAYMLSKSKAVWTVGGKETSTVTVAAGKTVSVSVTLTMDESEKKYIDESFENGMYVEGFLKLKSSVDGQCDLSLPFLGFYGDWEESPMLDYTSFEIAESEQDGSVKEEDKLKASVFATQPYTSYYNEKYVLPMGGYVYLLPDDAEPMYVDEARCSVSRYNNYYGEGNAENYMTSTEIRAVYAGLLKNAREVRYKMYNVETGELVLSDTIYRVGKAYAGGGSATPSNVELRLSPEEYGLAANGTYRMEFEFFQNKAEEDEVAPEENTYSFSFTVDYDAPILEDARVRYYNYKDGNKEKQRIYLDVDIYDNHYAMAMMLCYPKQDSDGQTVLQLATEYPTPVRNANPNGTTTVSIEITDIYERYGSQFYIQIDDYAVNSCLYQLDIKEANATVLPEYNEFELADGQDELTLDIYGTHTVSLVYGENYTGSADPSNFLWKSVNPGIADVKNGQIVGLSQGTTEIVVSNRKGSSRTITVNVTDKVGSIATIPSLSFGLIKTDQDAIEKASGNVSVAAGKEFQLEVITDPWYHPLTNLRFLWTSTREDVATVDQNGNVKTLKRGTTVITAQVQEKVVQDGVEQWVTRLYSAMVTLQVQNEYTVSNYTLQKYNGVGGVVTIPTDMNIWYIGEEAFKDNDNITKIIIPSSVIQIQARAFENCTALEEVYFVSDEKQPIADADLALILEQAFYNCPNLKKVDLSNVKTITLGREAFGNCPSLTEVVDWQSIGTMHDMAFANCSITDVDLTGLHMSGEYVFMNNPITSIKTGRFTAIGDYMFAGCTTLTGEKLDDEFKGILLNTGKIGVGAFKDCVNLQGVRFATPAGEAAIEFDIGAYAFENCGKNLDDFAVDFGNEIIRSIGTRAFAGSSLKKFSAISGLESVGANIFAGTSITTIYLNDTIDIEKMLLNGTPFSGIRLTVVSGSTLYKEENGIIYNGDQSKVLYVNPSVTGVVTLPESVKAIGAYAFANSNVGHVILSEALYEIGVGAFENAKLKTVVFSGSALTAISDNAFAGTLLTYVELPDSVTKLGAYAFADSALTTLVADGLTEIGNGAFEDCIVLSDIVLSDNIRKMGDYVFAGCTSLTEVTLPSLTELGASTFYGATALKKVTYGAGATVTGTYTFMNSSVEEVVFANGITVIGEGLFYNSRNLETVTLPELVRTIEASAFDSCSRLTTVNGLENVQYIGNRAFYNTALETLDLENALEIGIGAFAAESRNGEDVAASYTSVSMPNVQKIGQFAFLNGDMESLTLPASLTAVDYGAFASAAKLNAITVAEGNANFFVDGGVLYRYIDKAEETSEVVCYPAALEGTVEEGSDKKTYAVKEGAVIVQAYAFYGLNEGVLDKVVLPYSINVIGDSAFFDSGVKEYTFESIQAPVLETVYRSEIAEDIEAASSIAYYKGYYYANFETYLYDFTEYVKEESELIINYPTNGKGYNNHIYSLYFGLKNTTGIQMEDTTRECIEIIEELYDVETILSWIDKKDTAEHETYLAIINDFSNTVQVARNNYNNAMKDANQSGYIDPSLGEKLTAVEIALREVKSAYGLIVNPSRIAVASTSTHKKIYYAGETFDMTGLQVTVTYEDGSVATIAAEGAEWTVLDNQPLQTYNNIVRIQYQTDTMDSPLMLSVPVRVNAQETVTDENMTGGTDDNVTNAPQPTLPEVVAPETAEQAGCGSVVGMLAVVLLPVAAFAIAKKKKD